MPRGCGSWSVRNAEYRFWASVNKNGPLHPVWGQCWQWTGAHMRKGYGRLSVRRVRVLAHRYSYTLHVGPISTDMKVLHRCDNPSCVNPDHLFLGTYADNNSDRNSKEREARGESHGKSKLTESLVRELRELVAASGPGRLSRFGSVNLAYGVIASFARKHNLHPNTVIAAAHGRTWRHVK